jgi:cysteine desulfurase
MSVCAEVAYMTVFLDAHSTTPLDVRVVQAMEPYFTAQYANPSSTHAFGVAAREAVETVRLQTARYLNAQPNQIFFTSGATESNNTVIKGLHAKVRPTYHEDLTILTSPLEHPSVLESAHYLTTLDPKLWEHYVSVDQEGSLVGFGEAVKALQDKSVLLCSIQAANHEIGTINHLNVIGECCQEQGWFFHTDATQAIGKVPIDVEALHLDALSFSAHKIGGPKGVGVLYLRDPDSLVPLLSGGLQETVRSGTLNVPGIIGLGKALELLEEVDWAYLAALRNRLWVLIHTAFPDTTLNGPLDRLPNNLNLSIPGVQSEVFVKGLYDVLVSSGSACKSGQDKPSDILLTIGAKHPDCAIRFGLWRGLTEDDIDYAANRIIEVAMEVRGEDQVPFDL